MDVNELSRGMEHFHKLNPTMQVSTMLVFLYIASKGVTNQQDIEMSLGLTGGTTSRNVSYWTDTKEFGVDGMGMVERFEDPRDRRHKILRLTPKGKRFYDLLRGLDNAKTSTKQKVDG